MGRQQKAQMQKLIDERQRLAAEIEAMRHRLEGLDIAIRLLEGEERNGHAFNGDAIVRRASVKETVLRLLGVFGETGLTAQEVVEKATELGESLDRASVSSLLSRLKKDGVLKLDGSKYQLVQNTSRESTPLPNDATPAATGDRKHATTVN